VIKRILSLLPASLLLAGSLASAQTSTPVIEIVGADDQLADNIRNHLRIGREACDTPLARLERLRSQVTANVVRAGLTSSVTSKLGIDSVAIDSGSDYRDSALGLGKYLSPNLFMRYDIGLFDRENALSLEYILSERLRLEVESGVSQSVDLTYTVEK